MIVIEYLLGTFDKVMDYNFTANVEANFDEVAKGNVEWVSVIRDFYEPFSEKVKKANDEEGKIGIRELGVHPETNKVVYAKIGRYGPMIQMGEKDDLDKPKFAKINKDVDFGSITLEKAIELLSWPKYLGSYEGNDLFVAIGKYGPYVRLDKTYASIGEEHSPDTITYDEAVELIKESLEIKKNRIIKEFKSKEIEVLNGKYGPYIKKGKKNFKIPPFHEAKDLTLKDCEEIIKNSKTSKKKSYKKKKK